MKSVLSAVIVVLGLSVCADAHEPVRHKAQSRTVCVCVQCKCQSCYCGPFVVKRRYVGRGVWNYSKGVTSRAWGGLATFVTAPFKEPLVIPQRRFLVTPGYYMYHPGSVREITPRSGHPRIPRTNLGAPAPPEH